MWVKFDGVVEVVQRRFVVALIVALIPLLKILVRGQALWCDGRGFSWHVG